MEAMKLPSESVIPVYTPGDVKKHVAYFVLLDGNGYPLSKHSNTSYLNSMESSLGKQSNNMSSYWLNRANVSLTGRDCNINDVEKASRAFQEVIENEITSRLRNGIDGVSATIASNEEVYRLMFARHLANQMTQVLYVPSELMTYFCYKHDKNGIGVSLLENNRLLNSLRAMLLFSRVMAETRNAVGMTKVDIKLDPEDPDPYKTSATVKHAFAKARAENFPLGSIVPIDITDRLQRAGLMFSYSGHPGMPDMEVTAVESNRSFGVPDSNLEDELRKRTVMTLGLTPETVDSAFSPEFATAVTTNQRISNALTYVSPDFSGFKVGVNYGFGETTNGNSDSSYMGAGLMYDNGPLSLGLGLERLNNGANSVAVSDIDAWSLGGSYDFGVAKLLAGYRESKVDRATGENKRLGYYVAATAPVGAGTVRVSYNRYENELANVKGKADQFAIGYVYGLSKRTSVYGTYAYIKNKDGANLYTLGSGGLKTNGSQQGVQVGVSHAF